MEIGGHLRHSRDCRALLPVALLAGAILWRLPLMGSIVAGVCLAGHLALNKGITFFFSFLSRCVPFCLYWGLMAGASMTITGEACKEALNAGFASAGRILLVFLLGGWLCTSFSARQIALAVEWYLRPLFKDSSWRIGLAMAIMLRLIPQTLRSLRQSWDAARLRLGRRSLPRKAACIALVFLKSIPSTSESIAYAVAARGLDKPEAWREIAPVSCKDWSAALGIILLEFSLFWL